jgi:predicted nucleotidyltransferase
MQGDDRMQKVKRELPESLINSVVEFCRENENIKAAFIFGSYGSKYQQESSDLDIAVLFENSPDFMEQMEIAAELELKLTQSIEVDLINLNKADLVMQHEIVTEGIKIYSKNDIETADFIEYVYKFGPDARIFVNKFTEDYMQGIKEDQNED